MQEIQLREYANVIWRRKKFIGVFILATLAITTLITLQKPRIYQADCIIEIGAETPDMALFQSMGQSTPYGWWWSTMRYYETQYQVLKSRSLLSKVAERALESGLVSKREFTPESLTRHFQGNLAVKADEKSRLVNLRFQDSDPARAQKLVNFMAKVYQDENLAKKLRGITEVSDWINARLLEIRKEKGRQEGELQKRKAEYGIVSLEDRGNIAKGNLVSLTESLNRLKSKRIELEAQYRKLRELVGRSNRVEDLLGVVNSDLLSKLKQDLADLRNRKSGLANRYKEKHPMIVQLNNNINEVEVLIRQEVENDVSRLKTRYLLAKAEEDSIAKALEKQKIETLRIGELNRQLVDIKIMTETNQELFQTLQKKLKEADLSALLRSNNIRVVDAALLPENPISPKIETNLLFALLVGLFGGIAFALAIEFMDDTLKNHEEVERYLQLPVLGIIPKYHAPEGGPADGKGIEFITQEQPKTPISEFFRTLRTNVLFLASSKNLQTLLMTSTGPGEGKTSMALNLAVTLAQVGQRTLLLDLDLRRPKLHHRFNSPSRKGISDYMMGESSLDDVLVKSEIENLDYILAGTLPPAPSELLASNKLNQFMADMAKHYDRILIDASPIAPVADAVVLAQQVGGVIMVVRALKTHRKAVVQAKEQLVAVKANILGVILNDVDIERSTYGNYQYYKYGYASYGPEVKGVTSEPELRV